MPTVGSVHMVVDDILSYCRLLEPNAPLALSDLGNQVIVQAIRDELPNYIYLKNVEHFYDNTVWFYGTSGDLRVVIGDSFQDALNVLERLQPKSVLEAIFLLEEYITTQAHTMIEPQSTDKGIHRSKTLMTTSIRAYSVLDILSSIVAAILFALSAYAIVKGVILLPSISSAIGIIAITIALVIRQRWLNHG